MVYPFEFKLHVIGLGKLLKTIIVNRRILHAQMSFLNIIISVSVYLAYHIIGMTVYKILKCRSTSNVKPPYIPFVVLRAFMAGAAGQAG